MILAIYPTLMYAKGGSSVCQMVADQGQEGGSYSTPAEGCTCQRPGLASYFTGASWDWSGLRIKVQGFICRLMNGKSLKSAYLKWTEWCRLIKMTCPGGEACYQQEAEPFGLGSCTDPSDEEAVSHPLLRLVNWTCVLICAPSWFLGISIKFSLFPRRFVNVLVYYGLSLGVSRLGTDLYLTQFIFGLIEIPARTLVLFVLPYSRRLCQSGFLATGGLSCLLMLAIPAGSQVSFIIELYKRFQTSWRCAVVSGTRMLAADPWSFVNLEAGPVIWVESGGWFKREGPRATVLWQILCVVLWEEG